MNKWNEETIINLINEVNTWINVINEKYIYKKKLAKWGWYENIWKNKQKINKINRKKPC